MAIGAVEECLGNMRGTGLDHSGLFRAMHELVVIPEVRFVKQSRFPAQLFPFCVSSFLRFQVRFAVSRQLSIWLSSAAVAGTRIASLVTMLAQHISPQYPSVRYILQRESLF